MGNSMKWQAFGASVLGTSHIRANLPCQDANEVRIISDERLLAAVADGLGSAAHSEEGAKIAIQAALDSLEKNLSAESISNPDEWNEILKKAFSSAIQKLRETSAETGIALREYGTTLMVAAVQNDWLAVGHLGDGAVVAMLSNGKTKSISAPQRGEYANEVMPLTGQGALDSVRFTTYQSEIEALALLTDGLQNLCIQNQTGEPYTQFFIPFFDAIKKPLDVEDTSNKLIEFLNSERVCSKTDDDKTLVVLGKINLSIQNQGEPENK
jgi:serine/threonine protein phosphatase PrpC